MQNIIISTPLSFSTQPKIVKAATTFLNTLDILPPAAQMPTAAPGSRGPQILNYSPPPPPQYTDALGIPGFPCHFLPLPFWCPPTAGSQSHVPRAGYSSSFTDQWSLQAPPTHNPSSLPSPRRASSPSGPSPAQFSLEPQDTPSNNQAKKSMGRGEGLQVGSLECLLWNKGSSRELESPWPPCCARKPGTSEWASRAELSGRARAASPAAPALPLAGAARVPMQMSPGRAGRLEGPCPGQKRLVSSAEGDRPPTGTTSVPSRGTPTRRVVASSWVAARKAPGLLRPLGGCGFGRRLQPKSFSLETYRNTWGLDWAGFRRIKERVSIITTIIIESLTRGKYWQ